MSAALSTAQVDYQISIAVGMGIPIEEVPDLWRQHMAWAEANTKPLMYGGRPWIKFCESQVRFIKERLALTDKDARRAEEASRRRKAEQRAQAEADAAYESQAVSLPAWLASLATSEDTLSPHEAALVRAGSAPGPGQHPGAWLEGALRGTRVPAARANACPVEGCGMPVRSWRGWQGNVYRSGKCADHGG